MLPTAHVEHQIPGRIRLRVPEKRGDASYFESVRQRLVEHPAVERLRVSSVTASIVVHHNGAAEPVTAAASERGLFKVARGATPPRPPAVRSNTNRASPSALDAAATGFAGLAVLQAFRAHDFGSAVENFWNAYGARRTLQRPGLAACFAAIGVYQALSGRFLGSATSLLFYSLATRQLASSERIGAGLVRGSGEPSDHRLEQHDPKKRQTVIFPKRS
jgi:hypothetical protein